MRYGPREQQLPFYVKFEALSQISLSYYDKQDTRSSGKNKSPTLLSLHIQYAVW
jgi:hypothetical protein